MIWCHEDGDAFDFRVWKKSRRCQYSENGLHDIDATWQPRRVDWNAHACTMMTLLVSGGGRHDWVNLCTVWPSHSKWLSKNSNKSASNFVLSLNIPPRNYLDDSEGFRGWCNECSTNKSVAQMPQKWLRICWKWSTFWKACNKQTPEKVEHVLAAFNKDQRLTGQELEADLGIPKTTGSEILMQEIPENTIRQLTVVPTEDFAQWFEQWKRRWENCVRSQSVYFERD